jgi:hypothetical protein
MISAMRASFTRRLAVALACLAYACLTVFASAAAAKAIASAPTESVHAYERQLAGGEIKSATFRAKNHSLHLTLNDGHHVVVAYAPAQAGHLRAALKAHGVSLVTKSAGHKLRYIAAGILIVLLLIVGGALLLIRRRRRAEEY